MEKKLIFYDGDCGFCNSAVQFILKYEKSPELYFSPLQSEFARDFLSKRGIEIHDLSTFYFWDGKAISARSTAALKLAKFLRFPINLLQIGWVMPRFIRDSIYRLISKYRKKIIGTYCVILSIDQKKRFISDLAHSTE